MYDYIGGNSSLCMIPLVRTDHYAKSDYYTHFMSTNSENPRHMWKSVNTILHRQK